MNPTSYPCRRCNARPGENCWFVLAGRLIERAIPHIEREQDARADGWKGGNEVQDLRA